MIVRFWAAAGLALLLRGGGICSDSLPSFIYTQATRYDSVAVLTAGERFPSGAALQIVAGSRKRVLAPGFAASADPCVSFDGERVLFSGKPKAGDRWQIWEIPVKGGPPRRVIMEPEDGIAPFYLPGDRIVYSRRTADGWQLVSASAGGLAPVQLTYGRGDRVACDVMRDGRILFEATHAASAGRDLYTVYSDGSGVETYRCDHGKDRHSARELLSGDILFESGRRFARFTSARAMALDLVLPKGGFAGPVAEIAERDWLVSYRPAVAAPYGLYRWTGVGVPEIVVSGERGAFQPVIVRPRPVPKRHPSALGEREGANLLCLNVYTSKLRISEGEVKSVRVWTMDGRGAAAMIGKAPVEKDGSFYVQAPGETPIRFELLDAAGRVVAAEKGSFWARSGEQRVCVGCHAGPERAPENAVPGVLRRTTEPVRLTVRGTR